MARFRNDTGSVLAVSDLGRQVGPFEEFDWPAYDPGVHGHVAGCTRLDDTPSGPAAGEPDGTDEHDNPETEASE